MYTGASYEERLRELNEEEPVQEQKMPVEELPAETEPVPVPEPVPVTEPIPEPVSEEPAPEKEPEQETPAPQPEVVPEWATTLMEQQTQLLQAVKTLSERKPAPAPAPQRTCSLEPLESKIFQMSEAVTKLEKVNVEVLRDSKNFQADSRMKMQRELDSYHKLFTDDVYASLLTEMAKIYVTCWKYISQQKDESMEELFDDYNVTIEQTAPGKSRSLRRCKTRKTVPTGDESLHGTVALSLNPSFSLGRNVLIKEVVDTYVYDPALKTPEESAEIPAEPVQQTAEQPCAETAEASDAE